MQGSLVLPVAAGVAIFILSQFFMKFILEPAVALKEALGELSHFFLFNQSKITNARGTHELQDNVKRLSAQLLAKKEAIPYYRIFGWMLRLPPEKAFINAAKELNRISYLLLSESPDESVDRSSKIHDSMVRIQEKLGVRVSYE